MSIALEINDLSYIPEQNKIFRSGDENKYILQNINLEITEGVIYGITGESGSGKTTLAKLITGILKPTQGKIAIRNEAKNNPVQILFQNNDELINPLREVKDILSEAGKPVDRKNEICNLVGIPEKHFNKKGYQLSGGERQRVGLARVLLAEPKLLILDEPFSAQDPESQLNLIDVLKKIDVQFNLTMICISHDIQALKKLCSEIAILYGGKIMEKGEASKLFHHPKHPYTNFLIEAGKYLLSRKSFGEQDSLTLNKIACPYYNRCDKRRDNCTNEVSKLISDKLVTYCNHPI